MDSITWTTDRFATVSGRSQALHGNRNVLPVAVAIAEANWSTIKAPEVVAALGGHLPSNRVLDGLDRLCRIGALRELPYPGRPHPRLFESMDSPYWAFAVDFGT
jgi:hypothetical protein